MTILIFLGVSLLAFGLAARFYSAYLARVLGEDPGRPTPANTRADGRDYVSTRPSILFAHHFSTIAGAGPIVGPTVAIIYGWAPAWLWVVLGGIFVGAAHDFAALFVTMREGGKSMAEVARKSLGPTSFILFLLFTLIMLFLVTSAFLSMVSVSLTSLWPLEKLGLDPDQTLLKTQMVNGVLQGRIGGIASTSVIIITALWPIFGAANQLLAALTLFTVTAWLLLSGRKYFFALAPAIFMMATTAASLVILLGKYLDAENYTLLVTDLVLLGLSAAMIVLLVARIAKGRQDAKA